MITARKHESPIIGNTNHIHAGYSQQPSGRESNGSALTELVITKHGHSESALILPMVAQLANHSSRWITWFTEEPVTSGQLAKFGFSGGGLRCVHISKDQDYRWMFWEALNNGTSEMVIGTFDCLTQQDVQHFETAAAEGGCQALLIRHR